MPENKRYKCQKRITVTRFVWGRNLGEAEQRAEDLDEAPEGLQRRQTKWRAKLNMPREESDGDHRQEAQ